MIEKIKVVRESGDYSKLLELIECDSHIFHHGYLLDDNNIDEYLSKFEKYGTIIEFDEILDLIRERPNFVEEIIHQIRDHKLNSGDYLSVFHFLYKKDIYSVLRVQIENDRVGYEPVIVLKIDNLECLYNRIREGE